MTIKLSEFAKKYFGAALLYPDWDHTVSKRMTIDGHLFTSTYIMSLSNGYGFDEYVNDIQERVKALITNGTKEFRWLQNKLSAIEYKGRVLDEIYMDNASVRIENKNKMAIIESDIINNSFFSYKPKDEDYEYCCDISCKLVIKDVTSPTKWKTDVPVVKLSPTLYVDTYAKNSFSDEFFRF